MTIFGDSVNVQDRQTVLARLGCQPPTSEAVEFRPAYIPETTQAAEGLGAEGKLRLIQIGKQEPPGDRKKAGEIYDDRMVSF